MFILDTLHRLLSFLKKPDQGSYRRMDAKFKIATFFSLLLLNVVFATIWIACYTWFTNFEWGKTSHLVSFYNIWLVVLVFVLVVPFIEELIFRLPLKYKRNYLLRFVIFLGTKYGPESSRERFEGTVLRLWRTYFWVFFYTSCLIFALMHIFNYTDYKQILMWSPLLTSVQLLLGFIVSYLRIRFGFLWGLYFHAMYNMLIISLLYMYVETRTPSNLIDNQETKDWISRTFNNDLDFEIENVSFKSYQVDHSTYTLTIIEGAAYKGVPSGYGVTPSHIFFDHTSTVHLLRILTHNHQLNVQDPDSLMLTVDLKMKKHQKNSDDARDILERELFKALSIK